MGPRDKLSTEDYEALIKEALQGLNVNMVFLKRQIPDRHGNAVIATMEYTPAQFARKLTDGLVYTEGNWQRPSPAQDLAPWIDQFQNHVGEWADATFPQADFFSILAHMREEVDELQEAIGASPKHGEVSSDVLNEAADILRLLLHLAHKERFSLIEAAVTKDAVNRQRQWEGDDNDRGYWKHLERAQGAAVA